MTRRDQNLRAWIQRESTRHYWQSMISHKGKIHSRSTNTRIRKAALEFSTLHILTILRQEPSTLTPAQTEIFPELFPIAS